MKKGVKDTKKLLFENMSKLNPDFKIDESVLNEGIENEGEIDLNQYYDPEKYREKVKQIKLTIDRLFKEGEFRIIDGIYKLFVKNEPAGVPALTETYIKEINDILNIFELHD